MQGKLKVPSSPTWFADLKPWSLLSTKEVTLIFDYYHNSLGSSGLTDAVASGRFPPPDVVLKRRRYWRLDTVKREIDRRHQIDKLKNKYKVVS